MDKAPESNPSQPIDVVTKMIDMNGLIGNITTWLPNYEDAILELYEIIEAQHFISIRTVNEMYDSSPISMLYYQKHPWSRSKTMLICNHMSIKPISKTKIVITYRIPFHKLEEKGIPNHDINQKNERRSRRFLEIQMTPDSETKQIEMFKNMGYVIDLNK